MMTSTELEFDIREVMDEKLGLGRRMAACQRIADHDQAQRAVIDGLSKKVKQLTAWSDKMFGTPCEEIRHQQIVEELEERIEQQAKENKTLRETLQTCQSRLGCGCGDILCATCSAAYDVADQALKEVS